MFVIAERVPETGDWSSRSLGRLGLRLVRGTQTLLDPVLQRQTVFLKQGLEKGSAANFTWFTIGLMENRRVSIFIRFNTEIKSAVRSQPPQIFNSLKFFELTGKLQNPF